MLNLNDDFYRFVESQKESDITRLILQKDKFRTFDFQLAIEQIEARKKIRQKLPTWYTNYRLLFPSGLSAEQASSEQTARYKQQLVIGSSVCDLTGGLGVDLYYLSRKAEQAFYVERFADYCETARHNFRELQATNITVIHDDGTRFASAPSPAIDTYYIDPARRGTENRRLFALSDYEPNVLTLIPQLLPKTKRIVIKVSPMADLSEGLFQLKRVTEVHVLSVKNECKELLFVLDRDHQDEPVQVVCANLDYEGRATEIFRFTPEEEHNAIPPYAEAGGQYLYEPNVSILKAGAFKCLTARYAVRKIAPNSHLYTSDKLIADFPGRKFTVLSTEPYSNRQINELSKRHGCANITVRNFPVSVEEIRKKSQIKDGGSVYIFATTSLTGKKIVIETQKTETAD